MASLDKAFIKAYRQQESAVGAISLDTSGTESLAEALEDRPLREAKSRTAAARHDGVLAALQSARPKVHPQRSAPSSSHEPGPEPSGKDVVLEADHQTIPPFLQNQPAKACQAPIDKTPSEVDEDANAGRTARIDSTQEAASERAVPPPHIDRGTQGPGTLLSQAGTTTETATVGEGLDCFGTVGVNSDGPAPQAAKPGLPISPAPVEAETGAEGETDARRFRPLLQVDRIAPSSVGQALQRRAGAELDRLADALAALAQRGRKVVGFASDKTGQGTTTLVGGAALRLAERGVSVAVVDADMADPQLASELGLLPEYGWEEALERSVSCEELVIESAEQPIALLPLCRRFPAASLPDDFTPFRESLAKLRQHYDLVLVDLGIPGDPLVGRMLKTLDTVLLVRDVRAVPAERVLDLHRTLSRAGVNVAGIVESFVRGG